MFLRLWIYFSIFSIHGFATRALENLALNKEADMSTQRTADSGAEGAVDGNTAQTIDSASCALTALDRAPEAWWRVDLNRTFAISELTIYLLNTELFRFRYYTVHVTDEKTDWKLSPYCTRNYWDVDGPSNFVLNLNCSSVGRYVTLWLNRPYDCSSSFNLNWCNILQLCEVQVFGCYPGNYSQDCNMPCPVNCRDDICSINDGLCYECKDGYLGDTCDTECEPGKFGRQCLNVCNGQCRTGKTCSHTNGLCSGGCMDEYTGVYCNETCTIGKFGTNCTETCGHCHQNSTCHRVDGSCKKGCAKGWEGQLCKTNCKQNTYSYNCSEECSGNCRGHVTCNRYTGMCDAGCEKGWSGPYCNESCRWKKFGMDCLRSCAMCEETCHRVTGECLNKDVTKLTNSAPLVVTASILSVIIVILIVIVVIQCRRNHGCNFRSAEGNSNPEPNHDSGDNIDMNYEDLQTREADKRVYDSLDDGSVVYQNATV